MDFPICPACNQSVIDDDAVDCPFCGASLKAKPGVKPAPAAPKPATTAAAKPAVVVPKPGINKPPAGKAALADDDFPFDIELTAGKAAIQALPNPTKQRQLKVVCPMCDTPGYLPANAAGQDVRCANAKCVMPVFTAPAPKKVEAPKPPPPPKSSNLPFIIGATLVLGLTVGAGLYFINSLPSRSGGTSKELDEEARQLMAEAGGKKKTSGAAKKTEDVAEKKETEAVATETAGIDKQELIKSALKQMKESALEKTAQRSKTYCRQLAAEASILTGDPAAMREHLAQLLKVNEEHSYYRITPLLEQFWIELSTGNKKAAGETLNTVLSEVPKFANNHGRSRQELAGRIATALVAAGRIPDALKLLADFYAVDADAQLAARLQVATDGRISVLSDRDSLLPWKYPQSAAVTASLINRGQIETAGKWAAAQTDEEAKTECLCLWAEEFAGRKAGAGSADAGGAIDAMVASLPPALGARVWARAGCGRFVANDEAGSLAAAQLAKSKLDQVQSPGECKMPAIKQFESFKLPDPLPLIQAATAAGELANLQAQIASTRAAAEESLDLALRYLDATAPSRTVAMQRHDEFNRLGLPGQIKLIKDELRKKNDDEARTAVNNYKRLLSECTDAAQKRFDIQTQLLSQLRTAGQGMDSKVWIVVNARQTAEDLNKRDNFFATALPGELREGLRGTDEEHAILGAWGRLHPGEEPRAPITAELGRRLEAGQFASAADYLQKAESKSNRREEIALMVSSRLAKQGKLTTAFEFIAKLKDMIDRENCYRLVASIATQQGQANEVWKQVSKVVQQTEKVAICRGLIAGLVGVPSKVDPKK